MHGHGGAALETALLQRVVQRDQRRCHAVARVALRDEDVLALEVLLERAALIQDRMIAARTDPHVEGGHHLLHDLRMPRGERRERQIQLIGTHGGHIGFPRRRFRQPHLQPRRQALDAQQEAVEQGIAQGAGKADVEGAGGFGRVKRGDVALVDGGPQVEHLAHLRTQLERLGRRRETVRHTDEERIVEDLAQPAQRVRYRWRRHVHFFRHVGGVPLAEQLDKNHQQLGIDVDHGTPWLRHVEKLNGQTLPMQQPNAA